MKKGVKWNPTLVEFSDGSKRQASTAESSGQRKGRGSNGGKNTGDEGRKKTTKPPVVRESCMAVLQLYMVSLDNSIINVLFSLCSPLHGPYLYT